MGFGFWLHVVVRYLDLCLFCGFGMLVWFAVLVGCVCVSGFRWLFCVAVLIGTCSLRFSGFRVMLLRWCWCCLWFVLRFWVGVVCGLRCDFGLLVD